MDVICERCKAEYEFDEALLGEKGTTVKCSACGHVFRVLPPSRDLARSHLKLRYAKDGTVKSLSSLRELQQRIRAGEVSFDDELGRDGFPFRPLREVPELKNFFASSVEAGLHKTTVRPDASRLGGAPAGDKTVEGRVPGGGAGATIVGRAAGQPSHPASKRPPLPSER
ncbi:MAG: Proline-rich protein, partial [Myxococcaceae bacterium]|nr:Proline-rich protein [Myxococcaceae bacterium]